MLANFFEWLSDTINSAERSFLDLLGALVPYLVPVIPAYLTYYHTRDMMGFPSWVAWTSAIVVEVLGLTSVTTAIRFWRHNLKYSKDTNRAPFKLALGVYIFYLVIVLLVNVILEAVAGTRSGWIITAIAGFVLLGVPSGVLVSIRSQYKEMLNDREKARAGGSVKPAGPNKRRKHASDYAPDILEMLKTEYAKTGKILAPKDITARLSLDHDKAKGYVSTLTTKWKSENNIKGPFEI